MNLLSPTKSRLQPLIFLQNGYYRTICSGHRACLSVVEISSGMFFTFWLRNVLCATTACTFSTAQLPKVFRTWNALSFLTCKCASRYNGVHFFDISTVFSAFSLANMLRATTALTFSTSQLPKVVRMWGVFSFFTCKCASRHNGVHFFDISTSKRGPELVCFVHFDFEMCFAPQRRAICYLSCGQMAPHPPLWRAYFSTLRSHKSWDKHGVSRLSYLFAHLHLLSSDSFSSLIFSLLLFSLLLFSSLLFYSLWLCPSLLFICPYCRKFDF